MIAKYIDTSAIINVIGNIYNNPNLLDSEKYHFNEEDFPQEFHKILFGSIYNLHALGAQEINIKTIEDYLNNKPKSLATYQSNKGKEYLEEISKNSQLSTFEFYYHRMKKMTLLRMYDRAGMDLSWIYDVDNILDSKKKQAQEEWLDNTPLEEIADTIDRKITEIKLKYVDGTDAEFVQAGEGILDLMKRLKQTPDVGYPLYGPLINTVSRGARLKKLYLRSAATGVGKTRAMIADTCSIGCGEIYDEKTGKWIENGTKEPTLYITTEQEIEEIQTMMLAFLSNVDENHIIYNKYEDGEWERVVHAAEVISKSPIHVKRLPDFSLTDIENTIKYAIHEYNVKYVFHDYLHTSMKILSEVTNKTGIKGLREDNVLFMMAIRLKDLCNEYGIFIMTATQLNASYQESETPDQNLLRGAKAIGDKIDLGMIMLEVTETDKKALSSLVTRLNVPMPEIKISIYKNRRGNWKGIYLWASARRGVCKIEPMFATKWDYTFVEMQDIKIKIDPKLTASAF